MSHSRNQNNGGWIGVDLDGTLAFYSSGMYPVIGPPIVKMLERVKRWVKSGTEVRIMTARAGQKHAEQMIQTWLMANGLPPLQVTNQKDFDMIELWDDRAVQVEFNTGVRVDGQADPFGD